jgi:hypothetical protein
MPKNSKVLVYEPVSGQNQTLILSANGTVDSRAMISVATIKDRNMLKVNQVTGKLVKVLDATLDETVTKGWAIYEYVAGTWVKLAEEETLDFVPEGTITAYEVTAGEVTVDNVKMELMKECFNLWTNLPHDQMNLRIEWGDGTIESQDDFFRSNHEAYETNGRSQYVFIHEYKEPGTYIVKITGSCYYRIDHGTDKMARIPEVWEAYKTEWKGAPRQNDNSKTPQPNYWNLMSRVFENDLPIAKNFTNMTQFCHGAVQLKKVAIPEECTYSQVVNAYGLFVECINLESATGMVAFEIASIKRSVGWFFAYCEKLITTDFMLPIYLKEAYMNTGYNEVFRGCAMLTVDLGTLIGAIGSPYVVLKGTFRDCPLITCSSASAARINAMLTHVEVANSSDCLSGCSDAVKALFPASIGGTKGAAPEEPVV